MRFDLPSKNYLQVNLQDSELRDLVLILPGGGYEFTSNREAEPVSRVFLEDGYHTAIYYYRESKLIHPEVKDEGLTALKILKNIPRVNRIFVIGFSAGGHLAAMLATSYPKMIQGTILAYPVISADPAISHQGCIHNLLGSNITRRRLDEISLEKQVTKDVAPVFIMHTNDDTSVPIENSLVFIEALKKHDIHVESHFYPEGRHGVSLATKEVAFQDMNPDDFVKQFGYISEWIEHAKSFLKRL
ncbi:MAG: alpha/beta hydrolase [Tenericutes bacterium]|nr:alpha/beta hydrolase [Mycoplasmatota bacterium]